MLRYTVEDMTCGHCVQTITRAVTTLNPAAKVSVDLASKAVEVTGEADSDAIVSAIREAGYTPVAAPQDDAAASDGQSCCGHC